MCAEAQVFPQDTSVFPFLVSTRDFNFVGIRKAHTTGFLTEIFNSINATAAQKLPRCTLFHAPCVTTRAIFTILFFTDILAFRIIVNLAIVLVLNITTATAARFPAYCISDDALGAVPYVSPILTAVAGNPINAC